MFSHERPAASTMAIQKEQRLLASGRTEAVASSVQQHIYSDEKLYFHDSDLSAYNLTIPMIIKCGSVPIEHIRSSVLRMINKHTIFRTAVRFNPECKQIEQYIQPLADDIYSFKYSHGITTLEELDCLLKNESLGKYWDIEKGRVLRCHVVQRSAVGNDDSLHEGDLIIFVVHHIAFDLSSYEPFLKALELACVRNQYQQSVLTIPQYIDFALYEQALLADTSTESKMNKARRFWTNLMHGYDWDRIRYLVPDENQTDRHHSGRGYSTSFTIDQDVVDAMMSFASTNNVTMFSLSLACYYTFLYKLTNHEDDLCVVSSAANRPEKEIQDMIGMFVNLLLYRIKIEPNTTFKHLVQQVHQLSNEILEHAFLPYQQIIDSQGKRENNVLPSMFFQYEPLILSITQKNSIELTVSEGSVVSGYYGPDLNHENRISRFDVSLTIIHDHHTPSTECFLNCSVDIFKHQDDVDLLSKRFQHILTQLFSFSTLQKPIHELTVLLPSELISLSDPSTYPVPKSSIINHQMSMTEASVFWLDTLHDCKLDQPLPLPFDRHRLSNEHRTGRGTSVSFDFGQDLSHAFLLHASSNNISLEHLTFAIYFISLFKLTNGQTDLCIAMNINNNRYREELKLIIGLFENVVPLRCQLDPHWCLHQLLEHVQEITTNSMKYSYFPLQHILNQLPHISKHAFLNTSLEFISYKNNNIMMIGDSQLVPESLSSIINEDEILNVSDFSLSIHHDMNTNQLSCTINASLDLFNRDTVEKISQRFHFILHQLSASIIENQMNKSIYELSLILSNEQYLMQSLNNTHISFSSPLTCIHHEFVYQVLKHPQKLAVELDDQSLTYSELLHYVQLLSLNLMNEYDIAPGEIICQCVERSLSMVIGMITIEMVGGIYCPLSHRDPQQRLHALLQQSGSHLVLVHNRTKAKFQSYVVSIDIDSVLINKDVKGDIDTHQLSTIIAAPEDIAYIIFTSGSTGAPKAAQIRHRNITQCMSSLVSIDAVNTNDTVVQIARCSFDVHVLDIIGTLIIGGTLIMLRPEGILDLEYFALVLKKKQITYIQAVPSLLRTFFTFLIETHQLIQAMHLRSVCSSGEPCTVDLIKLLTSYIPEKCVIWNLYGPAETIICTYHHVELEANMKTISIGLTMPNYQYLILDDFLQSVVINQESELYIGGVGVFAGYLKRGDLTAKALININDELYYRTGDLVRMDDNGFLHYITRKDFQIKLHGQRIELGEIERCLLNASISACVVTKWGDDHIVAYVQSTNTDEKQLREHCQTHLPPHMIPSMFIILDKFPLNSNGKIDRKQLPLPQFSILTNSNQTDLILLAPLEEHLQRIFSDAFHKESPNVDISFGQMGGTSLDAMRALWLIRQQICTKIDVGLLFVNPSVRQLARAIEPFMWSINNSYWLKHLLGTPFYKSYLRLCGARIGCHSHIYTTLIDAPWLIDVGDFTFIGEEVMFSSLSYQDQTYELHRIQIGSYCSIDIRSVLYENVVIEDYVYIEPMSSITGSATSGHYALNSYYYLHKVWLRQLIITSFGRSLKFIREHNVLASIFLRWLRAQVGDDTDFSELQQILYFPSNLLHIESGVTTFDGVKLAPFQMTKNGLCCLDEIYLGIDTNLGNDCIIMPGTRLSPKTIVGINTLVTRHTVSKDIDRVLLGIPAREMPFVMPDTTSL
ncbi:unnamed protein product, partial [Adineta steineri]